MSTHTIHYRGYEIDPLKDPYETGAWRVCPIEEATVFQIFPPSESEPCLGEAPETLAEAKAAVDIDIAHRSTPTAN
ncbi:hypothetical protein [Croceicoccus naphthovorans]|uniref:Uncharacterized protein n=1 Tax=Croceicoccus naphthovorans TaxID=1348774 RepID=A0A0G3XFF1_9SPHN|nr:hypothetical protein [Croceicoccus naphthovorans]AKM09371.1 hypothetical protein AB433_04230 [Croceicoccus naphthovorans]MBB3990292.1 hypothetical protein [Croceicoccus naphthovorans]